MKRLCAVADHPWATSVVWFYLGSAYVICHSLNINFLNRDHHQQHPSDTGWWLVSLVLYFFNGAGKAQGTQVSRSPLDRSRSISRWQPSRHSRPRSYVIYLCQTIVLGIRSLRFATRSQRQYAFPASVVPGARLPSRSVNCGRISPSIIVIGETTCEHLR